jgi:hypothetical protein
VLEPHREQRWREAARLTDSVLEAWVMRVLDEAAAAALDETSPLSTGPMPLGPSKHLSKADDA